MDLKNDSDLQQAVDNVLANPWPNTWIEDLSTFLERVRTADLDTRASGEFHQMIWEEPGQRRGHGYREHSLSH